MKRRGFIQGALLAIPLIACKGSIAKDVHSVVTPFEKFRAEALPLVTVYILPSRGIFGSTRSIHQLRLCFSDGNPVPSTESYDDTYEDYFDSDDDLEKLTDDFISFAYQHITKHTDA